MQALLMAAVVATASPALTAPRPQPTPLVAATPQLGSAAGRATTQLGTPSATPHLLAGASPRPSPRPEARPEGKQASPSPRPSREPAVHHKNHPGKHPPHVVSRPHRRQHLEDELSPREVVKFFCGLDAEGARIEDTALRGEIHKLDAWDEEPGWDEVTVIRSFSVGDAESYGNFSHVEVKFTVIGTLTEGRLEPMPPIQTVEFHLERRGKVWTIESPLYEPHVFRSELMHQLSKGHPAPAVLKALAAVR